MLESIIKESLSKRRKVATWWMSKPCNDYVHSMMFITLMLHLIFNWTLFHACTIVAYHKNCLLHYMYITMSLDDLGCDIDKPHKWRNPSIHYSSIKLKDGWRRLFTTQCYEHVVYKSPYTSKLQMFSYTQHQTSSI